MTRTLKCNVRPCGGRMTVHQPFKSPKMEAKGKRGWQCIDCRSVKWLPADDEKVR